MGFRKCCVIHCTNSREFTQGSLPSYHKFPARSRDYYRTAWTQFAAREHGWQPSTSSYMCSDHFCPEDFDSRCRTHRTLKANAIPTVRPVMGIPPERAKFFPRCLFPLPPVSGCGSEDVDMSVEEQEPPVNTDATLSMDHEESDVHTENALRQCFSTLPSISEDNVMSFEEQEPPATEIQFTYSVLRSSLSSVTLPSEWNTFLDDDDFVMFFRIDKLSYEITHAVIVAADLIPKIRIRNRLYNGNAFGHIPLENLWCLQELLLSLSCATICPGLESNFGGGCGLVYKGGAAWCPGCRARKQGITYKRTRNNVPEESDDDYSVRKSSRRMKRPEPSTDMENLDLLKSRNEVGLPTDGIPFDADKYDPLVPKRCRRSARTTVISPKYPTENLHNSLPVDSWCGISEELPALDTVLSEETGRTTGVFADLSEVGIANVQLNKFAGSAHEDRRIHKKTCHLCGFVQDHPKKGLSYHIRQAHPDYAARWTVECMLCGKKFPSEMSLKIHVKKMHKNNSATVTTDPNAIEAAIEHMKTTGRFTYYCVTCHRNYVSKAVLDLHQFQHSPPDTSTEHRQRDCPACHFHAPTFADLTSHMVQHALRHGDKTPCLICGRCVRKLRQHIRDHHPEEMRRIEADWAEQCDKCGEKFKSKRMLGLHKTSAHVGFQCRYCAKRYNKPRELGHHVLEHKVDGVFPCPLCVKKFPTYPFMAGHYRIYHDITRAKFCDICRKAIGGGDKKVAAHMKSCVQGKAAQPRQPGERGKHKEMYATVKAKFQGAALGQRLPCDQCGQLFASAVSMTRHIRWMHDGDLKERFEKIKKEKKKQGIKVYSRPGYLKPREWLSLEDFPHRCHECQLGFIKETNLLKHRDTRHPEKCADSELVTFSYTVHQLIS